MARSTELELDLELPRSQRIAAWAGLGCFLLVAALTWREGVRQGQGGVALGLRTGMSLIQGAVLFAVATSLEARRLRVEVGRLRVVSRLSGIPLLAGWAQGGVSLPLAEVALEWIGPVLTLQNPATGLSLRLGYRKGQGPAIAAWLVAQGVRPPVGG